MNQILFQIAARAAACGALAAALFWWVGTWAIALAIPLAGVLLARPLLDLASELKHGVKAQALRSIEGRHAEFRGRPLDVLEDDEGRRWIATKGLRRIVRGLPADAVLARLAPDGVAAARHGAPARVEAEALLAVLSRATDADTHRFVRWVEREIVQPARRVRGEAIGAPLRATPPGSSAEAATGKRQDGIASAEQPPGPTGGQRLVGPDPVAARPGARG